MSEISGDTRMSGGESVVTAVVPVYNRPDDLGRLLASFKGLKFAGKLSVIIVDDGGRADYGAIIDQFRDDCPGIGLSLIKNVTNAGPGVSRNAALDKIREGYVWFLDSDVEIPLPDTLENALNILKRDPKIAAVGGDAILIDGLPIARSTVWYPNMFYRDTFCRLEDSFSGYVPVLSAANLLIDRARLNEAGAFDPRMKMFEDAELCFRLKKKGYLLYSGKEVSVYHHCSSKGREGFFSFFNELSRYTDLFHRERVKLVALNKRWILPLLPVLDLFLGLKLLVFQNRNRYNAARIMSVKKGRKIGLFELAFHHLLGMIRSYAYAYRVFVTGRI